MLSLLLAVSALTLSAQGKTGVGDTGLSGFATDNDTTYTFRFVPQKDMFYVPWRNNGQELASLLEFVENHKTDITDGRLPVCVDGYCNSGESRQASLAIAKIRSNRVKSELIVRKGLREDNFVTHNHFADGDYVTVRIVLPKATVPVAEDRQPYREEEETVQTPPESDRTTERANDTAEATAPSQLQKQEQVQEEILPVPAKPSAFALRANLLRWATLTPDLGVEWRVNERWSLQLNGTWTSWSWNGKQRRYALWEISPEVRYHLGAGERSYIGVMGHTGHFNYKLSETGKQGNLVGGGMTGGYILPLGSGFSLDFTIGVGCSYVDFDKYRVSDGVRVRAGKGNKYYFGVNRLGVTLVYNLKHGGARR